MIKDNLVEIEQNIISACERSKRKRNEITLIAVSKTKPIEMLNEAFAEGITEFGENKVRELCEKFKAFEAMNEAVNWHFIGHLQRNKVKSVIDKAIIIHSVDSFRLAEQINKEAEKLNLTCDVLVEVNIANEDTKFGIKVDNLEIFLKEISIFRHIRIRGLMTIAPYTENAEENRLYFRKMKHLCVDIMHKNIDNVTMDMLSMGMTGDYEVAIEEGATHIRVGTGIFGDRDYNSIAGNR